MRKRENFNEQIKEFIDIIREKLPKINQQEVFKAVVEERKAKILEKIFKESKQKEIVVRLMGIFEFKKINPRFNPLDLISIS